MEQLLGYIATGLVSLVVGLLLQRYQSKPKLLYWLPGSFLFDLNEPKMLLRTDSLTIQNDGRKQATNLEILYQQRPDHFQFSTAISYTEETSPNGNFIIKIPSLGSKEFVKIQLLSHTQQPVLLNVRSAEGAAQHIQVHLQRLLPQWFQALAALLLILGAGFAIYWLVKAAIFLSYSIGIVQ